MDRNEKTYSNPPRYRLDFIKENTFNRVWSVRMTRLRVILVSAAVVGGLLAMIWVAMAYTPMRYLLPGTLKGDLRSRYLDTALRLDSMERRAALNEAYLSNIAALFADSLVAAEPAAVEISVPDSLLAASEAEKQFIRKYEEETRFNLSVLAPIAAEGMVFARPVAQPGTRNAAVSAVYRGTVVGIAVDAAGLATVTIQHPNDFVSVYSGLAEVFTDKGAKVVAGQRIGHAPAAGNINFELWHNGTLLDPQEYIDL